MMAGLSCLLAGWEDGRDGRTGAASYIQQVP